MSETTPTGVSEKVSPRDAARNSIYNKTKPIEEKEEVIQEELSPADSTEVIDPPEEIEDPIEDPIEPPKERMVKVKINGREEEVPESKVISSYQKDQAAAEKLRFASEQAKEIAKRQELLKAQEVELQRREKELEQRAKTPPIGDTVKAYHTAIIDGDEEKAAELFKQITGRQQTTLSEEEIIAKATHKMREEMQENALKEWNREADEADEVFLTRFPQVKTDPALEGAVKGIINRITIEYPHWRPHQVMTETANRLDEWVSSQNLPLKERQARKASVSSVTGASKRNVTPPPEPPLTRSQVIAGMRQARGKT